jgi:hypothetical protein
MWMLGTISTISSYTINSTYTNHAYHSADGANT